jgi:small subunit ribosomal protein S13
MRISGITVPDNKRIDVALTAIYGIGRPLAITLLKKAGVDAHRKPKDLNPAEENEVRRLVEACKIEGELKRDIGANVKRLKDIKAYRGIRHLRRLPVHGQRTKTNSRTVRGNLRKTMGSGRKIVDKK